MNNWKNVWKAYTRSSNFPLSVIFNLASVLQHENQSDAAHKHNETTSPKPDAPTALLPLLVPIPNAMVCTVAPITSSYPGRRIDLIDCMPYLSFATGISRSYQTLLLNAPCCGNVELPRQQVKYTRHFTATTIAQKQNCIIASLASFFPSMLRATIIPTAPRHS